MCKKFMTGMMVMLVSMFSVPALAIDELNVAYFLEWPSANQRAQMEKTYDKALGMPVNWRSFDNGTAMNAAMVAGDIDIAYSQGLVPFVLGVSKGIDVVMVGVALTYSENDNCVVHRDAGITQRNAKMLEGKPVGSPTGNVTHYKLLSTLTHLGVDPSKVRILSMANSDVSSALARGDIVMGCAFGGPLARMLEYGDVLMTGAEQEAIGMKVYDIVAITGKLHRENPDIVTKFLQITEEENRDYYRNPKAFYDPLTRASGMDRASMISMLQKFSFPSKEQQLTEEWMNGGVAEYVKGIADFFVDLGEIDKALTLEQYAQTIDARYLEQVK